MAPPPAATHPDQPPAVFTRENTLPSVARTLTIMLPAALDATAGAAVSPPPMLSQGAHVVARPAASTSVDVCQRALSVPSTKTSMRRPSVVPAAGPLAAPARSSWKGPNAPYVDVV
jgi:hypothetical protein